MWEVDDSDFIGLDWMGLDGVCAWVQRLVVILDGRTRLLSWRGVGHSESALS